MRSVTREGITWEVDQPDIWDFWSVWEEGWEQDTLDVMARFLHEGSIFVDVGAWIGPLSLWAIALGAHSIAVEPDPLAIQFLRKNLAANAVESSYGIWPCAVSVEGVGEVFLNPDYRGWGTSMSRTDSQHGLRVPSHSIEGILQGQIPDLVKIDIEGYETEILGSVAPFLAARKVPLLVALHSQDKLLSFRWFAGYSSLKFPNLSQLLAVP